MKNIPDAQQGLSKILPNSCPSDGNQFYQKISSPDSLIPTRITIETVIPHQTAILIIRVQIPTCQSSPNIQAKAPEIDKVFFIYFANGDFGALVHT